MSASHMKTTTVQLPEKLLKKLKSIALKNGRSVAAQIRMMLTDSITQEEPTK